MLQNVLCYGDSLTWGWNPQGPSRHNYEDRWPSVVQKMLGNDVRIIAEGLNGRTTAYHDATVAENRHGAYILPTILGTHAPLDLVVLMLGTNDLKPSIAGSAFAARQGLERLIQIIRTHPYNFGMSTPEILLVSPPHIVETADEYFSAMFMGGVAQSKNLALYYSDAADTLGCGFFDAASVAKANNIDGVHMDADNTRALGQAIAPVIRLMLG